MIDISPTHPSSFPSTSLSDTPQGSLTNPSDEDWGDFMHGTQREGQGSCKTLASSISHRKLAIRRYENGVVAVDLKLPDIEHLVLSGGGAKGVAFSGMVKALEETQALEKIRTLSGSSAGAISAAFLASGMGHADFDKMSDETNLVSLLDSQSKVLGPIQQFSSTIGNGLAKIPGKTGNIGKLLFDLLPRLQSKATELERLVQTEMVKSIESRSPHAQLSPASEACVKEIRAKGYVTFGDLEQLRKDMPDIKQLNITGTAMFDGSPQMVVFNASLTPDMDVARAAHISGSLPVVFQKPSEQQLPFQADGERTRFQDGGIMLNTPVLDLYEPQFPISSIPESDQLILKFQSENDGIKKDRGTLFSAMADKFVGVRYAARDAQEADGIQAFANKTVIVPLKTEKGNFTGALQGTVNFSMPLAHKNHLQQKLAIEVGQHLSRHDTTETYLFNSLGGALLALNDSLFEVVAHQFQSDPEFKAVIDFRQQAKQALTNLKHALTDAKTTTNDMLELTKDIRETMDTLDQLGDTAAKRDWLAKRLNHGNHADVMELLQAIKRMDTGAAGPKSVVMTEAIEEMGFRDVVTKSDNFIREVIYPSRFRVGQPDSNIKLLDNAASDLRVARTSEDYNQALLHIIDRYVARNSPFSGFSSSTTVDQARAWLIPG